MMNDRLLACVLVLAALGATYACSSSGGSAQECTSGATQACTCADGKGGSQVCSSAGLWGACSCAPCSVTPSCTGKACGANDGCGNPCQMGSCTDAALVCVAGVCQTCPAGPKCTGKMCGDDDTCGGKCTSAPCTNPKDTCKAGVCVPPICTPVCVKCGDDDGCGTGTKCTTGTCDVGFKCSAGTCAVDPSSKWVITFTTGSIPVDKGWNTLSKPDPMACIWIGGSMVCTQDSPDTLSPSWGCAFPAISASTLMTGIDVASWDNDRSGSGTCGETLTVAPGDGICARGTVTVAPSNFKAKTWSWSCPPAMTINATLTPL